MTIKQAIIELLNNGGGRVALHDNVDLEYFTRDGIGEPCDVLNVIMGDFARVGTIYAISARDYDGIIAEAGAVIAEHYAAAAAMIANDIKNGYKGGRA